MNGEQALISINDNLSALRIDVTHVMTDGCAKREGDLQRIGAVEKKLDGLGSKMDKIFYTTLVTAGGIIAFLLKAFIPLIIK